jgi:hypothetical protein
MVSVGINGAKAIGGLGPGSEGLFRRRQVEVLAQFARDTVVERVRRGVGSNDAAMPALSRKTSAVRSRGKVVRIQSGYAAWKAARGLQPMRDLWGTGKDGGHMLDNLTVRQVSEQSARIAFTQTKARQKALANEKRTPFLSFSDGDMSRIAKRAGEMFGAEVRAIGSVTEAIRRVRRRVA